MEVASCYIGIYLQLTALTTPVPPHVLMAQVHTDFTIVFALIIHAVLQTLLLRVTLL